ncbi:serine/arginine repetitive matrix protein 1 isoform X2 [Oryza brachyantha]|uniref:serine/arginine repetitive matrix protein 1 isoform X2 n=1 Tax=Oryza brachyantha TaxID=4533 RepID=UPI001AD9A203|nr:serine/arginine repetitive matrix protein 1 isoform X2 [Oryza brachyantha]
MVAMGAEDEEERRMHQGCMAGFLHLFDRPQILSGKRLPHQPRRLLSSSSGSATPSERSMQLDRSPERATALPSPDMTPPAAPRPSLQLPPMEMKDGGGAPAVWRLPRLSLDSRAVVDARGKLRPREIRTSPVAPPSPGAGGDERRSPSVVARLMGLDALPHGVEAGDERAAPCGGELRRSASERVPRDPACFRFVDPSFFEKPSPPVTPQQRPSSPGAEAALRRAPDPACPRVFQRRSRFDAHDVFPEPAKRVDSAAAVHGEIALYGEIERRLRKRGIAEPARDLETLKQILEALQLKGLLRHTPPPPVSSMRNQPPPIVVMRPSSRPPQPPASRTSPTRRIRVDVDNARRPRSPDRAASPARSPASPARRGPQSPQRRVSPAQSPRYQPPARKLSAGDAAAGVRSRIVRRAGHGTASLSPDDDASTTFSDGGSSGSLSASSRWDFERARPDELRTDRSLLERCGKLLNSIQAFTAGDDQQPSPVSVLDAAAFLADEDSPSSSGGGSKRAIYFGAASPRPATASDPEDDEWGLHDTWTAVGPDAASLGDPDYAYVAEVVKLLDRMRDPSEAYAAAEKARAGGDTCHHRRLLCGAAAEALDRRRAACAWDPVAWRRGGELVAHVWAEVKRCRDPVAPPESDLDLNELIRGGVVRDLAADHHRWPPQRLPGAEVADAVLHIERLVFKDLVADTIRELADVDRRLPRRKLVF